VKSKLFASATRVSHCAQWCDWNRWTYLVGETTAKPCCRAALQCSAPEWALRLLPGDCRSTTHTHTVLLGSASSAMRTESVFDAD